ncbi:MAG: threonine synthase [Spirochaetota bacterium]
MKFASTRDMKKTVTFREAVFSGLAPDGGLYLPLESPDLRPLFERFTAETSFTETATRITSTILAGDFSSDSAAQICERAFNFSPELRKITDKIYLLELFHGPSCAFKDFGASFLAAIMEEFLLSHNKRAIILTATSGDTGSAVARAFKGKKNIDVVILYPSGRVSPLQEKQLTTIGENVIALEVKGNFDDCQKMVKEAFVNPLLQRKLNLTSANSINLGRLIPQSFYYVHASNLLKTKKNNLFFSVPSGNFGNLTAGVLAWKWGLPAKGFIAATNINDVVPEYLKTRVFTPRPSKQTCSNAMDVGNPSNFERLQALFGHSWEKMHSLIMEDVVTDKETMDTISEIYQQYKIFVDPHTAVGYLAAERYLKKRDSSDSTVVVLSTAHPAKFLEIVSQATGVNPDIPSVLQEALNLPKKSILIEKTLEALTQFLLKTFT